MNKKYVVLKKILIVYVLITVLLFVIVNIYTFAVAAIIGGIALLSFTANLKKSEKTQKPVRIPDYIVFLVVFGGFPFLTPPLTVHTNHFWQYCIQKSYIAVYRNNREPEWFPDFRQDVEDMTFEYLPSVMQGDGYYSVTFHTTPEAIQKYEDFAVKGMENWKQETGVTAYDANTIYVYINKQLRDSASAEVYILSGSANQNRWHTAAVIIDKEQGIVQLSQVG